MDNKTLELLLANYKAIYSQMKLPCAEKDYRLAQKGEIPSRWWKSVKRSMH